MSEKQDVIMDIVLLQIQIIQIFVAMNMIYLEKLLIIVVPNVTHKDHVMMDMWI